MELIAKKTTVTHSTSGDMPKSWLNLLNQDGEYIELALAWQLVG